MPVPRSSFPVIEARFCAVAPIAPRFSSTSSARLPSRRSALRFRLSVRLVTLSATVESWSTTSAKPAGVSPSRVSPGSARLAVGVPSVRAMKRSPLNARKSRRASESFFTSKRESIAILTTTVPCSIRMPSTRPALMPARRTSAPVSRPCTSRKVA